MLPCRQYLNHMRNTPHLSHLLILNFAIILFFFFNFFTCLQILLTRCILYSRFHLNLILSLVIIIIINGDVSVMWVFFFFYGGFTIVTRQGTFSCKCVTRMYLIYFPGLQIYESQIEKKYATYFNVIKYYYFKCNYTIL